LTFVSFIKKIRRIIWLVEHSFFKYLARNTNNLTVVINGIIEGLELPWNGVSENGCEDIIVGYCPMRAGMHYFVEIISC
jgi:hypothetical protein